MAESYQSFQGQEPNIDVNLFVNAMSAGIQQGNQQLTVGGAIAQGITQGVTGGIQAATGIQQIRATNAQLEIAEDPAVQEAKKQQAIAQSQILQRENDTQAKTQSVDQVTAELTSQVKNSQATIAAKDSFSLKGLVEALGSGMHEYGTAMLGNPDVQQALNRNPVIGQQTIATLRQQGADPAMLDPLQKQYDTLAYQNASTKAKNNLQNLAAKKAVQDEGLAASMQSKINTTPELSSVFKKDTFDPNLLDYRMHKKKSPNDPTTYDAVYGSQILVPNAITKDEIKETHKELAAWKASFQKDAGSPPASFNKPTASPSTGGVTVDGLHRKLTERDITAGATNVPVEALPADTVKQSKVSVDPFLQGAVKLGGLSPETVEKAAPAFRSLQSAITSVVNGGNIEAPASQDILNTAINHTANAISDYIFDSSPAAQASYTMTQVKQYNDRLTRAYLGSEPYNNEAVIIPLGKSEKSPLPQDIPDTSFLKNFTVTTPKELYFANTGANIVKQVKTFTDKALEAHIKLKQQSELNAKSNTEASSTLRGLAGG